MSGPTLLQRIVTSFLTLLFRLQDFIRSLWGGKAEGPHEPPLLPDLRASKDGGWGYLPSRYSELLFYRYWLSADGASPRAIVIAVHGLGAHGGHFWVLGQHLAKQGIRTYALDLRGHGYSEGPRGNLYPASMTVDGILDLARFVVADCRFPPVFILGESLGANLVMMAAARQDPVIAGVVLAGCTVEPTESATTGNLLGTLWEYARYAPYVFFNSEARAIDITGREERVSRDRSEVERTRTDPLRNNRQSPRTFGEVYRVVAEVGETARQIKVPAFLLQGGHDLVTNPSAVWKLRDALGSRHVEVKVFPDAYHGLFFDPDTPNVLLAVSQWLDRQIVRLRQ